MANSGGFGAFSLLPAIDGSVVNPGVDNQGRAVRQRRHHTKSRQGCTNCKSRKIKCDERRPTCHKCSIQGLQCDFDQSNGERQLALYHDRPDQQNLSSGSDAARSSGTNGRCLGHVTGSRPSFSTRELGAPALGLENLQLMYHFEHFTSGTLLFGKSLWRDQILPLALQHEYLMHAILTISASHLHYLQPQLSKYSKAAAVHLDHALSGFRVGLSSIKLPQQHPDVVIACGFVLLHYAWSVPFFNAPNDKSPSFESDGLLWFASGVKAVILAVYEREPQDGIFHAYLKADQVQRLYTWSKQTSCSYDFEENFLRQSQVPREIPKGSCLQGCGSTNAGERLLPIFQAVDAITRGQDISNIMPSILAYSLMWPSKAMQAFQDEFKNRNLSAMVTMLSFYASSWLILSERVWWAHHRSKVMCKAILTHLSREQPSPWDHNISKIAEYFGFHTNPNGTWDVGSPATQLGQLA